MIDNFKDLFKDLPTPERPSYADLCNQLITTNLELMQDKPQELSLDLLEALKRLKELAQ